MDSFSTMLPMISQLINMLSSKNKGQQSTDELERMVRDAVNDGLHQQAAAREREMMNSLMDLLKESIMRPVETRRDTELEELLKKFVQMNTGKATEQSGEDAMNTNKKMVMEVLQEMLNDQKSQNDSRSKAHEGTRSSDLVLPWCDKPNVDSQAKFSGKQNQPFEKKGYVNDSQGKNFNKDKKGAYGKKGFDGHPKNVYPGRGGFKGGDKWKVSQEKFSNNNRNNEAAACPVNNTSQASAHNYRADQHQRNYIPDQSQHGYGYDQQFVGQWQHWQQEGAVGSRVPNIAQNVAPHQNLSNNQMYPQPFGKPSAHASSNYQPGFTSHSGGSLQTGFPREQYRHAAPHLPQPYPHVPPQNTPQFGNFGLQPSMAPAQGRENVYYQSTRPNFSPRGNPRGNNFRGRGGAQRGAFNNRGSHANRPESRDHHTHGSTSDLTSSLSLEEMSTIKNVLKTDVNTSTKMSNKNKVAFKPKKKNQSEKQNADAFDDGDSDVQDGDEAKNLVTNNKELSEKLPGEEESKGAKKKKTKKNTNKNVKPDNDQKSIITAAETSSAAAPSESLKLLIGLGINKDVLSNVDSNQEIKHVVLIASSGDETKTFQPTRVKEFREFMEKYPKAEAIIVKKE